MLAPPAILRKEKVDMKVVLLFLSQMASAISINPTPFPVFLKAGFSSVLEFEEVPIQIVLGDPSTFQVEKLNKAIAIKPLTNYATTNMFVYFKTKETRLFILTASEESEPTYYKRFQSLVAPAPEFKKAAVTTKYNRGGRITTTEFDKTKDYLTIDLELSADSGSVLIPVWEDIRLHYKDRFIKPNKLWSERREVQRDSKIKARVIFTKPNVPRDMKAVSIIIPLRDSGKSLSLSLGRKN